MATDNSNSVFEFRGVKDLFYAQILEDSEENFRTLTPKRLSYVATISKETESSSETHYYDNKGMIVIAAKGATTYTLTVAPLKLDILADITGQGFDPSTGAMYEIDEANLRYFAIGYKAKGTDGFYRYVWKYKGLFGIPSEEVNTESDSIDTTNTELTYTAVTPVHKIGGGGLFDNESTSGIIVDERYGKLTGIDTWWTSNVQTAETIAEHVSTG